MSGETAQMTVSFELPPIDSCSKWVKREALYGTSSDFPDWGAFARVFTKSLYQNNNINHYSCSTGHRTTDQKSNLLHKVLCYFHKLYCCVTLTSLHNNYLMLKNVKVMIANFVSYNVIKNAFPCTVSILLPCKLSTIRHLMEYKGYGIIPKPWQGLLYIFVFPCTLSTWVINFISI